jgi:hypothetical protein
VTHAMNRPTPGFFAYVASSAQSDSLVLDTYNGVPSLLVLEIDSVPYLAWMSHGHGRPTQMWLYIPLAVDEGDYVIDRPDLPVADWITAKVGRAAFVGVAREDVLLIVAPWEIPPVAPSSLLTEIVGKAVGEMYKALDLSGAGLPDGWLRAHAHPSTGLPEGTAHTLREALRELASVP